MKARILFFCCFVIFIDLTSVNLFAQPSVNAKSVYLHTDRAYYAPGESVFFKAYLLDNQVNGNGQKNDTLHLAMIDREGIEVSNGKFPIQNSLFSGKIDIPDFLTEGSYVLIASTSLSNSLSPANMFSKIVEIRNPEESDLTTELSLTDTLYHSGSPLTVHVKITGTNNPVTFNYQLMGATGELLNGKGKTNGEGTTIIKLQLPDFDNHQILKLLISPLYKNTKKVIGIIIPTNPEIKQEKIAASVNSNTYLKIMINPLKQNYVCGDRVQMELTVTNDKGEPAMANLSVSASNLIPYHFPIDYNNIIEYTNYNSAGLPVASDLSKTGAAVPENLNSHSYFKDEVRNYFVQALNRYTLTPGRTFIVQEKNNLKKLKKRQEAIVAQSGYSSDRNIMDIIMQIKPYHIDNGKITFGIGTMNSINNQDGALIVVDGIKSGTDVSVLSTIPVQDIAHITVSTNLMDIQKYSAMNNVGIIDITMKKATEFLNNKPTLLKGNTLYWEPDMIVDNTGKKTIDFLTNENSKEIIVTVNGINGKGVYGCTTLHYPVTH